MDTQYYIFGAVCIAIVIVIAFILGFTEKRKSEIDPKPLEDNTENGETELSQALENLKIYNNASF